MSILTLWAGRTLLIGRFPIGSNRQHVPTAPFVRDAWLKSRESGFSDTTAG
jgi:hypothetical protein